LSDRKNEKRQETDRDMLMRIGKKFAVLYFVVFMFDSLLDWSLALLDNCSS